jgi:predicted GNAT family N-acyltransferase
MNTHQTPPPSPSPVTLHVGSWATLGKDASAVRAAVFIIEQGIPQEMEWDEADARCTHAVAYNPLGLAVGTGRLLPSDPDHTPGIGRIGRMAVSKDVRGMGVGRGILQTLLQAAKVRGDHEVLLHAQTSAEHFYAVLGFVPRGPVFDEAGIAHQEMFIRL